MDLKKKISTATPEENAAAFNRARSIVEKVTPFLVDAKPADEAMALQLLIARSGLKMGLQPKELLILIAQNLPTLTQMWESAFIEARKAKP